MVWPIIDYNRKSVDYSQISINQARNCISRLIGEKVKYMSLVMRKHVFGSFQPGQTQLARSATEASMRLEILVTETRDITLSRQRTTKVLIRLRGCAGWSAPLLFAYDTRHVFSWPGSYEFVSFIAFLGL